MNKTLLLILCDFLLLTLLALTRWEDASPPPPATATAPAPASNTPAPSPAATASEDLVAVMRLSLEEENSARLALDRELAATAEARAAAEAERSRLAAELARESATAATLQNDLAATRDTAAAERARREALDRELAAREAEARRREEELARVGAAEREARARAEELAVTVGAARREAELLQAQTVTLRETIEAERAERVRVQATTSELAAGVGQLAERSGQLAQEIRENRPLNANALFDDFLSRRVASRFIGERESFLGPVRREQQTHTVLVSDGQSSVALLHLDDTPFELLSSSPPDWRRLTLTLSRAEHSVTARQVAFASLDPRILLVALTPEESARLAPTPYLLALDPFKFPEAVLINAGGRGYGELPFKLDPARRGYVQVDNRLFRRLFGDFSPSRGDLVLSKTGELLGVMVSAETCALISHLLPSTGFPLGPELPPGAATPALTEAAKRLRLLQP